MSVASLEIEFVEAPAGLDVPVPGRGPQLTVDAVQRFRAVAAVQIHFTLQAIDIDLAVARAQIDFALARHLYDHLHAMLAPIDGQAMVRKAHVNLDRVAILMLFNA